MITSVGGSVGPGGGLLFSEGSCVHSAPLALTCEAPPKHKAADKQMEVSKALTLFISDLLIFTLDLNASAFASIVT